MKVFVLCIALLVVSCITASPLSEEVDENFDNNETVSNEMNEGDALPLENDNDRKVSGEASAVEEITDDYDDSNESENVEKQLTQDEMEKLYGIPIPICLQYTDNVHPLHLSHLSDCGKFYKCSNGRGFLLDCPIGEHWSVKLNRCDYPYSANCIADGVYRYRIKKVKPMPAQATFQIQEENSPTDDEIIPEFEIDARCEGSDPFKPYHFKHKSDCNKFYKCYMGKAYVLKCPKYQQWSESMSRCEHPSTARCTVARPAALPAAQSFEVIGVGNFDENYYDYGEEEEEADFKIKDARCLLENNDRFHPTQFSHPNDCGSFYKCIDDTAVKINCPAGLHYNVASESCDYSYRARCTSGIRPAKEVMQQPMPQYNGMMPDFEMLKEHPEMGSYFVMMQQYPELMSYYYAMLLQQYPGFMQQYPGLMQQYPGMMQQYPGMMPQMPSAPNLPDSQPKPDPAPKPPQPNNQMPQPQPFPQPGPEFPNWMPIPKPNVPLPNIPDNSDESDDQENFVFKNGKVSKNCPGEESPLEPVHLGHENDCSKFYKCFNGRAFIMNCPSGQEWSDSLQRCDFHEFSNCDPLELVKKKIQI
ncbi:CLUMA_CG015046, isoform A [Clunio marinus]|uniref:CLUMA_CG015046, isoform A n=1 Tax=Clunio marinus TaxID=568069 RepID=A0A1J1IQG8_9DIPT|nr:CLUMA_CG015046, isoform A [Clunio marinus]